MLQLTKRTEYGLIALVHLADRGDELVSAREVCDRFPLPRRLVAEALKDLARADLLISQRGATGGYGLARSADEITLGQVVAALEGRPTMASCEALGPARGGECEVEATCPIRSPIHRIRERLWHLMERTTLRSITEFPQAILPSESDSLLTREP